MFFLLTAVQKVIKNQSSFSRIMITNVLPRFQWNTLYINVFTIFRSRVANAVFNQHYLCLSFCLQVDNTWLTSSICRIQQKSIKTNSQKRLSADLLLYKSW